MVRNPLDSAAARSCASPVQQTSAVTHYRGTRAGSDLSDDLSEVGDTGGLKLLVLVPLRDRVQHARWICKSSASHARHTCPCHLVHYVGSPLSVLWYGLLVSGAPGESLAEGITVMLTQHRPYVSTTLS